MFKYKGVNEQLIEERKKNAYLQAKLNKANADIEYLAMMSNIELEDEEVNINEDEVSEG